MPLIRIFLLVVALLLSYASEGVAREIGGEFTVGHWVGAAYSDDTTGAFSACVAGADFPSGLTMMVTVGRNYGWAWGFSGPSWRFRVSQQFNLAFKIDYGPWLNATATAVQADALQVILPADSALVEMFRHGQTLYLSDGTNTLSFDLTGTRALVARLALCVGSQLSAEQRIAPTQTSKSATANTTPNSAPSAKSVSSGTGLVISSKGYVVTNNHVVDGCSSVSVRKPGAPPQPAEVAVVNKENDLALLKVALTIDEVDVARVRIGRPLPAGEAIAVYGFPLAGALSSTGNIVAGNITAVAGLGDNIDHFQISAPIQPGNSGGPLLDMHGAVVGIVDSKLNELAVAKVLGSLPQNVNFAIKSDVLVNFLEAHSVPYETQEVAPDLDLAGVAAVAKKFTVLVVCQP